MLVMSPATDNTLLYVSAETILPAFFRSVLLSSQLPQVHVLDWSLRVLYPHGPHAQEMVAHPDSVQNQRNQ